MEPKETEYWLKLKGELDSAEERKKRLGIASLIIIKNKRNSQFKRAYVKGEAA